MADKLDGDGLIEELCNRFQLLMDREKEGDFDGDGNQDPISPQQTADEVPVDEVPVDEVPIQSTPAPSNPALVNAEVPVQQSHGVIRAARGGVMAGRGGGVRGRRVRKTSERIAKIGLKKMVIPKDGSGCGQDEPVALD
ncbi:hypothetical protein L1887_27764 [Cichorium endivia]|nr:hypothetical protein L1887_27764 [Cichorium endivia]